MPKPNTRSSTRIIRESISYLFQNYALIDDFSVKDNLLVGLKYVKAKKMEKEARISEVLKTVNLEGYEKEKSMNCQVESNKEFQLPALC